LNNKALDNNFKYSGGLARSENNPKLTDEFLILKNFSA